MLCTLGALLRSPLLNWYGYLLAVEILAADGSHRHSSSEMCPQLTGITLSVNT